MYPLSTHDTNVISQTSSMDIIYDSKMGNLNHIVCWKKMVNYVLPFDVTHNVISLPVSVCQDHSGNEDSFLCLLSILDFAKFRR